MTDRAKSKMRRSRGQREGADIVSRLPSADRPASRIAQAPATDQIQDQVQGTFVAGAGEGPLALAEVRDRILQGDSARVLARLPDGFAACAITSPPYWNLVDYGCEGQIGGESYETYRARLIEVWQQVARCLRPNGKFCLNVPLMPLRKAVSAQAFGPTHTRVLLDLYADLKADILARTDLRFYSLYIWEKQTTEKMFGSYPFPPNLYERNTIEFIAVFVKPGKPLKLAPEVKEAARLTSQDWMELTKQIWWMYPANVRRAEGHPAPFPETLPNRLIHMYSFPRVEEADYPGDVILDPLAGWGTTCVAAKRAGRRYVGVELNPAFCAQAARRLEETPLDPQVMPAQRPS